MVGPAEQPKHRLKLKGSIGHGAFGYIRKGIFDGETVAVKTMLKSESGGDNARMFFEEARVLQSCDHKRIIGYKGLLKLPATDAKEIKPVWALVMEFAKHGTLRDRVVAQMVQPNSRQYDTLQALSWALDAGSALEYLHLRTPAVLHRDVKSANIMLTAEEGRLVAKLSDFGLHVTVDSSKYTLTRRRSGFTPDSSEGVKCSSSAAPMGATTVMVTTAPTTPSSTSASNKSLDNSSHEATGDAKPTAAQQGRALIGSQGTLLRQQGEQLQQQQHGVCTPRAAASAAEHHIYSEVHDSGGSRVFVDTHSTARTALAGQQQQQGHASGAATRFPMLPRRPISRRTSFRRAAHHPTEDALPRLPSVGGEGAIGGSSEAAGDANAVLLAHWRDQVGGGSSTGGSSVCSLATDGTWVTGGTGASGTDTAGSDCTDDTAGSIYDELETVFDLTGHTGSCLYMAPEVYLNQSYNEKSDVFSFGVVLYELMARTLIAFTELPTNGDDATAPQRYAAKVAGGYRPSQPKGVPDPIWALISACWQQDPVLRPHMSEVVAVLSQAVADAAAQQPPSRMTSFGKPGRSNRQVAAPATVAARCAAQQTGRQPAAHDKVGKPAAESESCTTVIHATAPQQAAEDAEVAGAKAPLGCGCVIC